MKLFEKRKWKKILQHTFHEARHARNMREDIAEPALLEALRQRENELETVWKEGRGGDELDTAIENLQTASHRLYPPGPQPAVREFVEVIVVALVIAMGLRAYFLQPFKIPTGSMQPTLNGILYSPVDHDPGLFDRVLPLRLTKYLITGKSYWQAKSSVSGLVQEVMEFNNEWYIRIGDRAEKVPKNVSLLIRQGSQINPGDRLARAWKHAGDHIFVDKIRYNFTKPKRGDVFVFSTAGIEHPQIKKNNYYIKRLCGLPGDTITIDPPYLVANGERVLEPPAFSRVVHDRDAGYNGYVFAHKDSSGNVPSILNGPDKQIKLGETEYLPLGDNSQSSLDGRYFGTVTEDYVVGPAFLVYWPFTRHWGLIN